MIVHRHRHHQYRCRSTATASSAAVVRWMAWTVVAAYSVQLVLGQVPCMAGKDLDDYVDSLFRFARRLVRVMEPISTPNATVDLEDVNLKVFLYDGGASRASTLQRKKAAWVHCTNQTVTLGLTIGFEELRIAYKYRVIADWNHVFDGSLEVQLTDPKLQVQFTQTLPPEDSDEVVQQRVDKLRIWRIGHARVILRGLGNLSQSMGMLLTRVINDSSDMLDPTLREMERRVIDYANVQLQNITVPFFSIV